MDCGNGNLRRWNVCAKDIRGKVDDLALMNMLRQSA